MRSVVFVVSASLLTTACAAGPTASTPAPRAAVTPATFPDAPTAPTGPNDEATAAFEAILASLPVGLTSIAELRAFADAGDVRHAWLLSDLLRFAGAGPEATALIDGFTTLTGVDAGGDIAAGRSPWNVVTNHLIAWDTPPPPDYRRLKGGLFAIAEPRWAPFFDDDDSDIDWRWVSWGGVFIDDRPLGDPEPCDRPGCIPALDDPALVPAEDGDWYDDAAIVFGITEGDEAVALPRNVMQVHEMVNMTIGGRRFGIPYCTLCGSAQAFYTDDVADGVEPPVLRTSGLLNRSNKVMYDLVTSSVFDTFTGAAVSGPLHDVGVVLRQNSVTVSTWGEWKQAHPGTSIIARDGGIGSTYDDDPLDGRDDGPIFPIGDVDGRLGAHDTVLGVLRDDGTTVAFDIVALGAAVAGGAPVRFDGVTVTGDAGGFGAQVDGREVGTHEAFWFAWSQFHPDTKLWPNDARDD